MPDRVNEPLVNCQNVLTRIVDVAVKQVTPDTLPK